MEGRQMQKWLVRAAIAGNMLAHANVVWGQPPVVDLKDFKPRQVQSAVFTLASPQDLRIEAVGAESADNRGAFSWVSAMWSPKDPRQDPWMGNAWILDLTTRRVVWELSAARTERGPRGTRAFSGAVRLPAGTYEAFYAAFPNVFVDGDGNSTASQRFLAWLTDQGFDDFRIRISGNAQPLAGDAAARARDELRGSAIVALRGEAGQKLLQAGFTIERPTDVEIYAIGEAGEDAEYDTGWIVNADTRETVWRLTWRGSETAGGAAKNRRVRVTRTLPAGRYAAFYGTDDSHDAHEWNAPPPHDPHAWGLFVRVHDAASRAAVRPFAYEHVPAAATFLEMTGIGDGEARSRGFTLTRAMDVRVYAIGEGRDGRMFDYAWITGGGSRQKVWEMRYADTAAAGGDPKNRLFDRAIRLEKGDYVVHYVTDDSHSAEAFNAPAPHDARRWGVTLLAAGGALDRAAVTAYVEKPDPDVVAQLARVRDGERPRASFRLAGETRVRIYALGEGTRGGMSDYGWIEDARTGRAVWEMTYRGSDPAGGASKNRRFDGTIVLPAGEYTLRYEADGSHAFGSWNSAPPDDPTMYGITVYRVR
jgi:hypothetical protein